MSDLVSVENLTIDFATNFGDVHALRGVSFSLKAGEVLGIVGESGSGKTVACRAILKLIAGNALVKSGRIMFEGSDVLAMKDADLGQLRGGQAAMIFQNPSTHLDPIMTVGRQVGEAMVVHQGVSWRQANARAVGLLEDMHIKDAPRRAGAYPHELSGGMRQRVMIAAALACEPKLLIADEPTTALDVTVQAQILDLLRGIRRERKLSVILVSHDLGVIAEMCDRVVVMKDGAVLEIGSVDQILRDPAHEYTKRLIASQPSLMKPTTHACPVATEPHLLVKNLCVSFYPGQSLAAWATRKPPQIVRAVDNVSLALRRGGALGIVGESGSGKSTIARAIAGLVQPEQGEIEVDGQSLDRALRQRRPEQVRKLQMVFQDPFMSLNPAFTVARTLAEPLRQQNICPERDIPERIRELMEKVELPRQLLDRRTTQLSGGQRQRVGIARALALEPEILIADEVTSALDVTIQAQVLGLFARLRRELSLTLILISHDLGVVRYLCEHVAVMQHGKLVEYGNTEDVLDRPQQAYTRELIAAIPKLSRRTSSGIQPGDTPLLAAGSKC
ncbi:ABC transporter ATP-binding protein [Mesorhizobium sp. M7A.F.Ca.MR.176.00.0.0]|uniref:dipeptide ABC transporter ATP-binding protein n=5 Tax=unclassified Mesorhizobium TaxID=325217 RepID=UPI000FD432E5|nr:ABC transporter ATP-binding protein [Mesorhizobium sp. M7A.F.Ca.MR.176.00.0.0]RUU91972.1 ABC transporter ATP-binding protein [Mesorhizobium sp. M7A.F.Ca.MR.176.00.0.0]